MGTKSKIVLTAVISVAATAFVTANAVNYYNRHLAAFLPARNEEQNLVNKLNTVESCLDSMYLYDYDSSALTESAITEYVESLDEPYTHYYPHDEFSGYIDALSEEYTGIGVTVSVNENNEIEIISTFENSPAYNAGILPGDILSKVEGEEFSGDRLNDAVARIKDGEAGTSVHITIRRGGKDMEMDVERGAIETDSVAGEMLDNGIGLVRISAFNTAAEDGEKDTYTEFKETVERLRGEGMEKMIIDLRDNPGGELSVVCNIADMLLPEGTITYIEYKDGDRDTYSSDAEALGIPLAVLINGGSASASEVLTGALKDYGAAEIIGTTSYGKGIVQNVMPFADGSGMSLTVARYFTPNGVCIHGVGIDPDKEVEMPEEYADFYASSVPHENDTQLQAAIDSLSD